MKRYISYKVCLLLVVFCYSCEILDDLDTETGYVRDQIVDTWRCEETSEIFGKSAYLVDISKSFSDSSNIILDNFYNLGFGVEVVASLSGFKVNIQPQIVDGNTISGKGTIAGNYRSISFDYTVNDGGGKIDRVTADFTRQ